MEMLKTVCATARRGGGYHLIYFILTDKIQQVYKSKVQTKGKSSKVKFKQEGNTV